MQDLGARSPAAREFSSKINEISGQNVGRMLAPILRRGMVLCCETCMAARGLTPAELVEGCRSARLGELGTLTLDADKVLTF